MARPDRRKLLAGASALFALGAIPSSVSGALDPADKFDLLVRNANVLDPSQGLSGKRDIGIRYGQIRAVEGTIDPGRAARVLDAAGKLVTPGLIDLHCHTFPYGSAIGIPADELVAHQATTTVVSAGDAGANNFAAYRRFIVPASRTRQFAFIHIAVAGLAGFPVPELYNIDYAQPEAAARAVAENADMVLGVKVRMSENVIAKHGLEPLNRAVRACELSGVPAKIMCHIGGVSDRALMSKILDVLRPGDVLTHCFSGAPNIDGEGTNIVQDGKLLPAALGMPYLPWVMSKFLGMGFSLSEVVSMATQVPARVIGRVPKHGTLQIGAPADLSVLELVEGPVDFVDTRNNKRKGNMVLRPSGTIVAGVAFGRPYQSPFSAR